VWHCLLDATFSRFGRTPTCDRQTDRQRQLIPTLASVARVKTIFSINSISSASYSSLSRTSGITSNITITVAQQLCGQTHTEIQHCSCLVKGERDQAQSWHCYVTTLGSHIHTCIQHTRYTDNEANVNTTKLQFMTTTDLVDNEEVVDDVTGG